MVSYFIKDTLRYVELRLNPCYSGRWSRTLNKSTGIVMTLGGLNPYCSGRWSRTGTLRVADVDPDFGLNPYCSGRWSRTQDYWLQEWCARCLNPYCSGRWSRTLKMKSLEI